MKNQNRNLKQLIEFGGLTFLLEAHDGVSAKIVEEAGFEGIWASSLTMSASFGVRDNNEASWTQVLEVVEFMADAVNIPILLDGDTGYGNFNNFSRVVRKLEQRGCAGVCIEDKLFPKTNSLIDSERQELADIDEFAGKIKAGKDNQTDPDFVIVARVEAFIAGWGLGEALKRAEAYRKAGADAILVHSKLNRPDEILAFMKEWGDRLPVVIVPTKYYATPMEVFEKAGVSTIIWANHLMRSAVVSMQLTARQIFEEKSLTTIEERIAPVSEIFRLQGADDLKRREELYLPKRAADTKAIILAASQGKEFRDLTRSDPKTLLDVGGKSILRRTVELMNEVGVKDITVVRGFAKDKIDVPGLQYVDNDEYASTQEACSLEMALKSMKGRTVVSYGDILYKKYVLVNLLESEADITIAVDAEWTRSKNVGRYADYVICDVPYDKSIFDQDVRLTRVVNSADEGGICGEWIGLICLGEKGTETVQNRLSRYEGQALKQLRMADLFNDLISGGLDISVQYIHGDWLDIDDLYDLRDAQAF